MTTEINEQAMIETSNMLSVKNRVLEMAQSITTDVTVETMAKVNNDLAIVKGFLTEADKLRAIDKLPALNLCKYIDDTYRKLLAPMVTIRDLINKNMVDVKKAEDARIAEEQKKLDRKAENQFNKAVAKGNTPLIPEPVAPLVGGNITSVKSEAGNTSFKEVYRWEYLTDKDKVAATSRIQPQFYKIDEDKITDIVQSMKDDAPSIVGGIRVWKDYIPVTRRAK